jgi:hypothetical protein
VYQAIATAQLKQIVKPTVNPVPQRNQSSISQFRSSYNSVSSIKPKSKIAELGFEELDYDDDDDPPP